MNVPVLGRLLPGWMQREQAVQFLLNQCRTDPPISPGIAGEIWRDYRTRVEELPVRPSVPPRTFPLSNAEHDASRRFLSNHPEAANVTGFVRINPMDLQVHQLQVAADYPLSASWVTTAMPEGE